MDGLIRVNGHIINAELIGCLLREKHPGYTGITIRFAAGGRVWVPDPEAQMVETAYEEWFRDRPYPH